MSTPLPSASAGSTSRGVAAARPGPSRAPPPAAFGPDGTAMPPPLPDTKDPFVLLGVDRSAAEGDMAAIKSAYLRRVKTYHPDASVTEATPEAVRKRINDDFSTIHHAYEELRNNDGLVGVWVRATKGRRAAASAEPASNARAWHEQRAGAGAGQAARTGSSGRSGRSGSSTGAPHPGTGGPGTPSTGRAPTPASYGYGQSMGASFQTSFDEKKARGSVGTNPGTNPTNPAPSASPRPSATSPPPASSAGGSYGFVGFARDEQASRMHNSGKSRGFVGFVNDEPPWCTHSKQHEHKSWEQHRRWSTKVGTPRSPFNAAAVRRATSAAAGPPRVDSAAYGRDLAAIKERCKALEHMLQRADRLTEATERERSRLAERLERAESLAESAEKEKAVLETMRATMVSEHMKEMRQLKERVKMLETEAKEFKRPWYQQSWRTTA